MLLGLQLWFGVLIVLPMRCFLPASCKSRSRLMVLGNSLLRSILHAMGTCIAVYMEWLVRAIGRPCERHKLHLIDRLSRAPAHPNGLHALWRCISPPQGPFLYMPWSATEILAQSLIRGLVLLSNVRRAASQPPADGCFFARRATLGTASRVSKS